MECKQEERWQGKQGRLDGVQEVREEMEELKILFICHTAVVEDHESWQQVSSRRKTCKRLRCSVLLGLDKVMTKSCRVLREDEDEDDDEDEEMSYVRAVDSQVCAAGMQGQGDAFSTKLSKKKVVL